MREVVDKVGPQLFKNFDKMRLIMFDPDRKKGRVTKSNSIHKLNKISQVKE